MQKTHYFNQITKDFTIDQYLHQLVGFDVEEDSLLRHACEMVWDLPTGGAIPSSLDVTVQSSRVTKVGNSFEFTKPNLFFFEIFFSVF